jgi:hypothetical protein
MRNLIHTLFSQQFERLYANLTQAQIQERYSTHRNARNAQQKKQLLSPDFPGLIIDQILKKLEDPSLEPGYIDPRNCLVFWARPPPKVRPLVSQVQQKLRALAPSQYLSSAPVSYAKSSAVLCIYS